MRRSIITFITDFGTKDGYVGVMKGVILKINPDVRFIDISHEISAQDILEASFVLKNSYDYFPDRSIHLVVVDPGVGSKRQAVAIEGENHFFIGPDNGVFSFIYEIGRIRRVVRLNNNRYFLSNISNTFHGRDIFAPVAAYLSLGTPLEDFGPVCKDLIQVSLPQPEVEEGIITGTIIHIDRFGNLISNISEVLFTESIGRDKYTIWIGDQMIDEVQDSYCEVKQGEILAIFGSSGYLEISKRDQNAKALLGLNKGSEIRILLK
ncbi:MAG: SAM-dependent chlorinase/fluorinase [Thermodesulfobacteriota bacterium]|nr:SAM-dependent chlorinase/fluorinase [Thermodesulfobacteriota bacterium]